MGSTSMQTGRQPVCEITYPKLQNWPRNVPRPLEIKWANYFANGFVQYANWSSNSLQNIARIASEFDSETCESEYVNNKQSFVVWTFIKIFNFYVFWTFIFLNFNAFGLICFRTFMFFNFYVFGLWKESNENLYKMNEKTNDVRAFILSHNFSIIHPKTFFTFFYSILTL